MFKLCAPIADLREFCVNPRHVIRQSTIENVQFFKIGLTLARKWKRMTQMSTQPFWGVFRKVFGVRS